MRKFVAIGAAALLTLAIAVPFATAGATTTPKTVTGSFIGAFAGPDADGTPVMFRFEVRTDASGAVQFGYFQQQPLPDTNNWSTLAVVDSVQFYRDSSGAKAALLRLTECSVATGYCNDEAVAVVTDGTPDTFCGGTPTEPCKWPFSVDDGNIVISGMAGQNGQ
jgi:hypothetical protein